MSRYDVVIVGGGGAGLFCALTAGQRGKRVLVLEGNDRVGRKIEISGGGRCNFTNLQASADNYLSENPSFCKSALARSTPWDFLALVEQHGIPYHEKTLGQQFCDGSSRAIIEMLLAECAAGGVAIRCGCRVEGVERTDAGFRLTAGRELFESRALVVATGGLSFPKLGASDFGHRLAQQFGLRVTPLRPGLVPLTLNPAELRDFGPLSGVSLPVVAMVTGQAKFAESLLFTHRGLSGPAVLQISSYWRDGAEVTFDLLPEVGVAAWLEDNRSEKDLPALLAQKWPRRLAETWAARHAPGVRLAHWRAEDREALARSIQSWRIQPAGTEGYAKAEVTLGGVDTAELSSKTMEARRVPGLYFIGEAVDMTGWLGGYNFQWAWSSGYAAGVAV